MTGLPLDATTRGLARREARFGIREGAAAVRQRWLLVLLCLVLAVVGSAAVYLVRGVTYAAEAQLLATPVARDDPTFIGLPVIRESSDPTRDVTTLTAYVQTPEVQEKAQQILAGMGFTPEQQGRAAQSLQVEPVAASFIVSITATADDPAAAAQIANAYAEAAISTRQRVLNDQLEPRLGRAQAALTQLPQGVSDATRTSLQDEIAQLQTLAGGPDPSLQILSLAGPQGEPTGPGFGLVLAASGLIGLLLGLAGAALEGAIRGRRVRDEEELFERFNLPVLARIPKVKSRRTGPLSPYQLGLLGSEGYDRLRLQLERFSGPGRRVRTVALTGPGPDDGRTTSALGAAIALADSGWRVLLVDADLTRPALTQVLGVAPTHGVHAVLAGEVRLRSAVIESPFRGNVSLLLVNGTEGSKPHVLNPKTLSSLIGQTKDVWDFVLFDAPSLENPGEIVPLVTTVDDVLVTVRRLHTRVDALDSLSDLIRWHRTGLRGFVMVGTRVSRRERPNGGGGHGPSPRELSEAPSTSHEQPASSESSGPPDGPSPPRTDEPAEGPSEQTIRTRVP